MKASDFPKLAGWLTFPEAGAVLGVSKQAVHKMAEQNELQTVHCVGEKLYVVSEEEIRKLQGVRQEAQDARVATREHKERVAARRAEEEREVPVPRKASGNTRLVSVEEL